MRNAPTNTDDVIDSRDVIARIEELTEERQALQDSLDESDACVRYHHDGEIPAEGDYTELVEYHDSKERLKEWDEENAAELKALTDLAGDAAGYSDDWEYGATLVRDSYFEDYAQELAEDSGAIDRNASWPYTCIDWDQAARELRMDYTSVEFDGVTYWVR